MQTTAERAGAPPVSGTQSAKLRWAGILLCLFILTLTFVGTVMRGPYWNIYWPWEIWPEIPGRI